MEYYSRSENESGEKELLSYHLERTSQLCGEFADDFGCKDAGTQLGNFHDLGKATPKFHEVLKHKITNPSITVRQVQCLLVIIRRLC